MTLTWKADAYGFLFGRFETRFRLAGPATLLDGVAFAGITASGVRNITGRAGRDVLALVPGSAPCDGRATVNINRISIARSTVVSDGRIDISESTCQPVGRPEITVSALTVDFFNDLQDGVATLTSDDATRKVLATARLTPNRQVNIRIEPAGARLVPGLPASAPTILEFDLD